MLLCLGMVNRVDRRHLMQGVDYESHNVVIKPELKAMYNEACDVWYEVKMATQTKNCRPEVICRSH